MPHSFIVPDEDDVAEMMSATGWALAKMCLVVLPRML